ncbi:alpha/beta-hydrolase [Neoconidiobolus thromboides FSU 785]|nr:alpha/beta-hydrolase [Neoconidiobolus thromboides FSU 785]
MNFLLFIYFYCSTIHSFLIWPFYNNNNITLNNNTLSNNTTIEGTIEGTKESSSFWDYFNKKKSNRQLKLAPFSVIEEAKYYAHYAGAAYCKDISTIKQWNCDLHCKLNPNQTVQIIDLFENKSIKTRSFIALNEIEKKIIISFRGSNQFHNFISDFKLFKLNYQLVEAYNGTKSDNKNNIRIHRGFFQCSESLKKNITLSLKKLYSKDSKYKDYHIILTGHSLGGSMAVLAALYLKQEFDLNSNDLSVYTYGQPRIGNSNFVNLIQQNQLKIIRVTNRNDPIPHSPPAILGFHHHGNELYISDPKTTILCNDDLKEDPMCSASRSYLLNLNMHLKVWNIPMGTYC